MQAFINCVIAQLFLPFKSMFNSSKNIDLKGKNIHLSLDIVDRLYRIWLDQGSVSAKIETRTDTSSYEFAHGKKIGDFCAQTPLKFDIVDRLYRGRGVCGLTLFVNACNIGHRDGVKLLLE